MFGATDLDLEIYTVDVVKKETTSIPSFNILNAISPRMHHLYSKESLESTINPGEEVLKNIIDGMVRLTKEEKIPEFRAINLSKIVSALFQNLIKEAEVLYFKEKKVKGRLMDEVLAIPLIEAGQENANNLDKPEYLIAIHYLQVLMEILFAVAREKGFLDLEAVAQEKVGKHYQLYLLTCRQLNKERSDQNKILPESLFEICQNLGLKNTTYSAKNFTIPAPMESSKESLRNRKKEAMKTWIFENLENCIKNLQEKYKTHNLPEACRVFDVFFERLFEGKMVLNERGILRKSEKFLENQELLTKALETLFGAANKDIYHPSESPAMAFFPEEIPNEVEKVHTWTRTDEISLENIKKDNWNEFWMLSQGGAWFFKGNIWEAVKSRVLRQKDDEKITIRIVATEFAYLEENAFDTYKSVLQRELENNVLTPEEKQKLQNNLEIIYEKIPYWEHHHMLSLFVKKDDFGNYKVQQALHASRDGNKDFISPVSLSREKERNGESVGHKTEEYLKYLEYLFKVYFLVSKRKKFDEMENGKAKSRPTTDYFLDIHGSSDRIRNRIDEEWDWAVKEK